MRDSYTRSEVDQMLQSLRDGLTIRENDAFYYVNRDAGGQTLEPTGVIGSEEFTPDNYMTISYVTTDGPAYFKIEIEDLPYITGYNFGTQGLRNVKIMSKTLKFTAGTGGVDLAATLSNSLPGSNTLSYGVQYISSMTAHDQITEYAAVEDSGAGNIPIFLRVNLNADGTHSFGDLVRPVKLIVPVMAHGPGSVLRPMLVYTKTTAKLQLYNYFDPNTNTQSILEMIDVPVPVDDNVIIGYSFGSTPALDILANESDYDTYFEIGVIKTEAGSSDEIILKEYINIVQFPHFGLTEEKVIYEYKDEGGFGQSQRETTFTIQNGLITKIESEDWSPVI